MRAPVHATEVGAATPPIQMQQPPIKVPILLALFGWSIKSTARLVRWSVRHPVTTLLLGCSVAVWQLAGSVGPWIYPAALMFVFVLLVGWRKLSPDTFRRAVVARFKGSVRAATFYRPQWDAGCEAMMLRRAINGRKYLPRLVKVRSLGPVDVVTARLLPGQTADEWSERADAMAHTFDSVSCRVKVREGTRRLIEMRFLAHDPFVKQVPPFKLNEGIDLDSVPVAMREEGYAYTVSIRGSHFLLVGESRSGKSSAMQEFIYAVAPAIGSGLAQLHTVDMKGGVEFVHVEPLATNHAYSRPADARDLLKKLAVDVLEPRLVRMREEGIRAHVPTVAEPLHVIAIDELAAITAYVQDGALRKEINSHLAMILSQGLGGGVVVVAGVQDGRKTVVELRGLFTHRIAFRLSESDDVDMVLSHGARNRGARCDEIPKGQRGVCYVDVDGEREPARLRFPYLTTADIKAAAARYAISDHTSNVVSLAQNEDTDQHQDGDDTDAAA